MELKEYINILKNKKQTLLIFVFIFILAAAIISFTQPFKYGASSRMLVIENFNKNVDPYTVSRSTDYISNLLAKVISSNTFYNQVMDSGFNIDRSYFFGNIKEQMKQWSKTVEATASSDTGIIVLDVYHKDKDQAEQISRAVAYTLQAKHSYYHGFGDDVAIKIIDEPILSGFPVKPNISANFGLALLFGLSFGMIYIYLFPEAEYSLRIRPRFNKRKKIINDPSRTEKIYAQLKNNWQLAEEPAAEQAPIQLSPSEKTADQPYSSARAEKTAGAPSVEIIQVNKEDKATADAILDESTIYEDIIKSGTMHNIFGKPNLDS